MPLNYRDKLHLQVIPVHLPSPKMQGCDGCEQGLDPQEQGQDQGLDY